MRFPTTWFAILSSLFLVASFTGLSAALQFCEVNEEKKTDLCFAIASSHNLTTHAKDLSLHLSARFPVPRTGWAAVGVGEEMKGALIFIMYPGFEDGSVTVSIRSTSGHISPSTLTSTPSVQAPDIHVTGTWVDENDLYNAQITCYDCSSWTGSTLDVQNTNQSWIWSANSRQKTGRADEDLHLVMHTNRGIAHLDMASSYSDSGEPAIAEVDAARVASPNENVPKKHHKHSIFGIVSIHGYLLSISFFVLSGGVLAIRSGLAKSFKYHWVIQAIAGSVIILGCGLGVVISFLHGGKFGTLHQFIGLLVVPTIILQTLFGYWHHVNFVRTGKRSAVSVYHVWIGRILVLVGNVNVGFGLRLGHASRTKYLFWVIGVLVQLAGLIPMWYFWSKGEKILDVFGSKQRVKERGEYEGVEEEAFLVGEDEEIELEGERDRKEDSEMK